MSTICQLNIGTHASYKEALCPASCGSERETIPCYLLATPFEIGKKHTFKIMYMKYSELASHLLVIGQEIMTMCSSCRNRQASYVPVNRSFNIYKNFEIAGSLQDFPCGPCTCSRQRIMFNRFGMPIVKLASLYNFARSHTHAIKKSIKPRFKAFYESHVHITIRSVL